MENEIRPISRGELLAKELEETSDPERFAVVLNQLTAELQKKEYKRISTFSEIQDLLVKQTKDRLENHADEMSNKDLISFMTAIQQILDKGKDTSQAQAPTIAVQQNIVNVGTPEMPREKRDRIRSAVDSILSSINNQIDDNTEVNDFDN